MKAAFFVTATDTGVGKTIVTGGLVRALKKRGCDVGVMKPVTSGAVRRGGALVSEDAEYLRAAAGIDDPVELVSPVLLEEPLAPFAVTQMTGRKVDTGKMLAACTALKFKNKLLFIEGIGGLMVPLKKKYNVVDLAADMDSSLIIVARPNLGTINHTSLTIQCARGAGLQVAGVIFNYCEKRKQGAAELTNAEIIRQVCEVPVLGTIPYLEDTSPEELSDAIFGPVAEKLLSVSEISRT